MSKNLAIYDAVRQVPAEAQKPIKAGRLKGMTDINPMWRIKTLTEQFGMCGRGWKYTIDDSQLIEGANGEIVAIIEISLYTHDGSSWSDPIPGTGGSKFVAKETAGMHTNDECYKMALTDALSVACKALGVGADIYWQADSSKYNGNSEPAEAPVTSKDAEKAFGGKAQVEVPAEKNPPAGKKTYDASGDDRVISEAQHKRMFAIAKGNKALMEEVATDAGFEKTNQVTRNVYEDVCAEIEERLKNPPEAQATIKDDDVPF